MPPLDFHILAADDDFVKFVFMIVVAAIVGIGSLISAAKKKQNDQEEQRKHSANWARVQEDMRQRAANATRALSQQPGGYAQVPARQPQQAPPVRPSPPASHPPSPPPVFAPTRSIGGHYVPPRPVPARRTPVPPRPAQSAPPTSRPPQSGRQKKQKSGWLPAAPPVAPAAPAIPPAIPAVARAVDVPPALRRGQPASTVDAAAVSRWLNPKTLRSQFILTEILQPPLALREPREQS